jgi:transcription initiation factor TFIIIB Brf1 subunit/transcription initiation factor TFIIB
MNRNKNGKAKKIAQRLESNEMKWGKTPHKSALKVNYLAEEMKQEAWRSQFAIKKCFSLNQ